MKIVMGMPGLKQAARLENERLVHQLAPYGYAPVQHTPSLWKHESNGIIFSLVVDDFGIKSTSDSATSHLLQDLRDKYQITVDPSGTKFLGFVLDWDYSTRKFYLSMPNYVQHKLVLGCPVSQQIESSGHTLVYCGGVGHVECV